MMIVNNAAFLTFLLCSYCTGWCLNGLTAREKRMLDLCQFVRSFIIAPFAWLLFCEFLFAIYQFVVAVLIPHAWMVLLITTSVIGSAVIMWIVSRYAVMPAVKQAYGVAKPFSDKICIVLYRKQI